MDQVFDIPGFPEVCRICLGAVSEEESILLESEEMEAISFKNDLFELKQQFEQFLPKRICPICHKRVEDFFVFRSESIANGQFLNAWAQLKYAADTVPLTELFRLDNSTTKIIRRTLHRLKVTGNEEFCLEDLLHTPSHRPEPETVDMQDEIKDEVDESQDPLTVAKIDDKAAEDPSNHQPISAPEIEETQQSNKYQQDSDSDYCAVNDVEDQSSDDEPLAKKSKRNFGPIEIVDGVRSRSCFFEDCIPVPVGQAEKHARENHRAYCKICGLVFPTHAQTIYHLAIHRPTELKFSCELCEKPFWREFDLKVHRRDFHGKDMANLECPYCEKRFGRRAELNKHRETHKNCKFCTKLFKGYKLVLDHMRERHGECMFSCKLCSLVFLGRKEHELHMEKHRDRVMENSIQFAINSWIGAQCVTCDRSYFNQQYLTEHVTNDHKNGISEKPVKVMVYKKRTKEELDQLEFKFQCKDCDQRFRLKTSLKGHWKKNHSGEQFICEHCGACFKSKSEMELHERYLHTKDFRFACEFCDKRCNTRGDLAVHRRSHTNEKPYKCSQEGCSKAYKTHGALTKHVRLHTGEKPYKCSYEGCDKAYICSQLLKVHVRRHTLEKPFKCWYCEQFFNSTNNRRKHCRRHHVGMPIGRELEKLNQQGQTTTAESTSTKSGGQ